MIEEVPADSSRVSRVFRSSFPRAEDTGFRTRAWQDGVAGSAAELEPLYSSMLHAFAHAAKADDRTGIKLYDDDSGRPADHRSYRWLYHRARSMAAALRDRGVAAGDPVLLVLPTSLEFVAGLFALQLLGAIPVPSYPPAVLARAPQAIRRLRQIAESSGATLCVTDRRLKPLLGEIATAGKLRAIVSVDTLDGDRKSIANVRVGGSDPALIQYTSGSTDRPRGVLLSHRNLVSNIHAIGQASRITRDDSGVVWLPLYHDMGLIGGLLFCIYWRIPLAMMSPMAFLADPMRWLQAMSDEGATLSPAPNFAYALCTKRAASAGVPRGLDLSRWRIAFNGAEPVSPATIDGFCESFGGAGFRRSAMLPVYGLAEVSLAASFPAVDAEPRYRWVDRAQLAAGRAVAARGEHAVGLTSVGRAVPGHHIHVVDEHGAGLPDGEVGHIVITGPSVMRGYYGDAHATDAVLRGDALWTGDLGFVADGELYVAGRAKDLIIVRGRNYYAEDIERQIAGVPGVRAGGVVAFAVYDEERAVDLVVAVCETRVTEHAERVRMVERIGQVVGEAVGIAVDEVVLARPGTIPKTPSGKVQRALCRQMLLAGELGRSRKGKLGVALTFARSGAGFLAAKTRSLLRRRAPE